MNNIIRDVNGNVVPVASIKGADGREVVLRVDSGWLQWRYADTDWTNLVSLAALTVKGDPGDSVEMQVTSASLLQYRVGAGVWETLFDMSTLSIAQWIFGTAVTGTGSGISVTVAGSKTGDVYFNTGTCNIYQATASNIWAYKGNNKGELSTSVDGILKASSGIISAATAGTDYQAPMTITTDANASPALGTLANNTEYRCTNASLSTAPTETIAAIASTATEFSAAVVYKSPGTTAPVVTNSSGYTLKYVGTDVSSGTFAPKAGTVYRISFVFDGIYLNAYVMGVV